MPFLGDFDLDPVKKAPPGWFEPEDIDEVQRVTVDGRFNLFSIARRLLSAKGLGRPKVRR